MEPVAGPDAKWMWHNGPNLSPGDHMKRLRIASLFLFLSCLTACSRPNENRNQKEGPAGSPVGGDWAIIQYQVEPENLNYVISQTAYADYVLHGSNNSFIQESL